MRTRNGMRTGNGTSRMSHKIKNVPIPPQECPHSSSHSSSPRPGNVTSRMSHKIMTVPTPTPLSPSPFLPPIPPLPIPPPIPPRDVVPGLRRAPLAAGHATVWVNGLTRPGFLRHDLQQHVRTHGDLPRERPVVGGD